MKGPASIGTRTGKVVHLARRLTYHEYTVTAPWCGRKIHKWVTKTDPANCQRCLDEHDHETGKAGHTLTLSGPDWDYTEATCSCGYTWESRGDAKTGDSACILAAHEHRRHIIDTYRASLTRED